MDVLVMEDDHDVRDLVRRVLERDGHNVTDAADGAAALRAVGEQRFDVVILDVSMSDMSGLDVLEELRSSQPDPHVIMLTGAGTEADRVLGLVSGADDYVVKPFSPRELAARLHAVARRQAVSRPVALEAEDLRIDLRAREVIVRHAPVTLTRREFDLLVHLVSNPRQTFSRRDLLEAVWGSAPEWQSEATVTEHVRRLRSKIERDPAHPDRIVTVQRGGYRFEPGMTADGLETNPAEAHRSNAGVVVVVDSIVVYANEAAASLVGVAGPDDLVGRDVREFVTPASLAAAGDSRDSIDVGDWPRPELTTLRRADGRDVLIELASRTASWEGSPASHITVTDVAADPTRVRELATGLRTDVPDPIIVVDPESRILSVNAAAEDLYGWHEEELVGRLVEEAIPWHAAPSDLPYEDVRAEVERHGHWHGTAVRGRRDGSLVRVRVSMALIRNAGGHALGVVSVDRPVERGDGDRSLETVSLDRDESIEISGAAARGELRLHYQPVVALESSSWVGVEALVRWQHPTQGLLPPRDFIGPAEQCGAIASIGEFVLREACAQGQRWRSEGRDLYVSVNVSARQLSDERFPDLVASLIQDTSTPPGALWVEVTETSLVRDVDHARAVLERIANLGVRISIDDFGTGWASLTYLRAFPVHALKIDRSFVAGLGVHATDNAIVSSILSLGQELDLTVIAEGVETAEQADFLGLLGCQFCQGYLFDEPRNVDEMRYGRSA